MVVVPVALLTWLVFFTRAFVIAAVTIVDARPHTTDLIREATTSYINKNIFFIPTDVIEQHLLINIPQIRDVHIERKLPGTLKIIVQEKTPALLLLSSKKYYFVDAEGIAYEEARLETLPGIILPTVKNNDQEVQLTLGTSVVDSGFIEFINAIAKDLPDIVGAKVVETRIPSLAAREVHFILDNNWQVRFDITRPPAGQLDVLKRLLTDTITPDERSKIEYIDLRIQNRVYYKTR